MADPATDPLALLQRWEASGANWRVTSRANGRLRIDLITCTGDEVVDVLESDDAALAAYIGERDSNED